MHIGHDLSTCYAMKESDKVIKLNSTEEEKDLGVFVTKDLKSHEQCGHPVRQESPICALHGKKTLQGN